MTIAFAQERAGREERGSAELRKQAEDALRKLAETAKRIERMTAIYRERLDGKRR